MAYTTRKINSEHGVYEKETDQIVAKFDERDKAKVLTRSLNLGKGFNGWTPEFFLYEYPKPNEI